MLEHPEISWIERTGYPSWMQNICESEDSDEDSAYDERMEDKLVEIIEGRWFING